MSSTNRLPQVRLLQVVPFIKIYFKKSISFPQAFNCFFAPGVGRMSPDAYALYMARVYGNGKEGIPQVEPHQAQPAQREARPLRRKSVSKPEPQSSSNRSKSRRRSSVARRPSVGRRRKSGSRGRRSIAEVSTPLTSRSTSRRRRRSVSRRRPVAKRNQSPAANRRRSNSAITSEQLSAETKRAGRDAMKPTTRSRPGVQFETIVGPAGTIKWRRGSHANWGILSSGSKFIVSRLGLCNNKFSGVKYHKVLFVYTY